jgi:hypothetical protein
MNRFFHILLRFAGRLAIVVVLICVVVRIYLYYTFHDAVTASRNVSVIVLGDSHPQNALIADSIGRSVNFSLGSERFPRTYKKLEILSERDSIRTVVLGISYHSFTPSDSQNTPDFLYRYGFTFYPFIRETGFPHYKKLLDDRAMMMDVVLCHELGILSRNSIAPIKGILMGIPLVNVPLRHVVPSPIDWESRIHWQYHTTAGDSVILKAPETSFVDALYDIHALCEKKGYKLVLFNAPVSPEYYAHIPLFYKHLTDSVVNSLVDNRTTCYLDYTQYPLPDSCYYDCDHINLYGANVVTPLLRDSLRSLGLL